jgi:glutamine amidotransferase
MISVLGFNTNSNELLEVLNKIKCNYLIAETEDEILTSNKLFIPPCDDLSLLLKKLNRSNLYQFIKMLKKDVLFIGKSMALLCEKCKEVQLPTFCMINNEIDNVIKDDLFHEVEILEKDKLFKDIDNSLLYFDCFFEMKILSNSLAKLKDKEVTVAIKKNNFYGVMFRPELSGEVGIQVIKNFLE